MSGKVYDFIYDGSNYQVVGSASSGGTITGDYLPLAGGTLTGDVSSHNLKPVASNTYELGTSTLNGRIYMQLHLQVI